jgi:hypothetical protein
MGGPVDRLGAVFYIEFFVNVVDVSLDGVNTKTELIGDIRIFGPG